MAIKLEDIEDLQTEFDGLLSLLSQSRRIGKTRAAVRLAGECKGLLITRTAEEARMLQRQYGVEAAPITNIQRARGKHKPLVMDQDAMVMLLQMVRKELAKTRRIIKKAHRRLNTGHSRTCAVYKGAGPCDCGHKELEDEIYNYKIGIAGETL